MHWHTPKEGRLPLEDSGWGVKRGRLVSIEWFVALAGLMRRVRVSAILCWGRWQVWNLLFSQGKYAQQQGLALNLTAVGPRCAMSSYCIAHRAHAAGTQP